MQAGGSVDGQGGGTSIDADLLEKIAAEIAFYANQAPIEVAARVVALLSDLGYRIVPNEMTPRAST